MAFFHEAFRKFTQYIDAVVLHVGPVEHVTLQDFSITVGEVARFLAVADYEDLDVAEKSGEGVFPVTHDLVECFRHVNAAAFQFHLHERQTIDQDGHIIAVCVFPLKGDLVGDLESIFAPFFRIEQL